MATPRPPVMENRHIDFSKADISSLSLADCSRLVSASVQDWGLRKRFKSSAPAIHAIVEANKSALNPQVISELLHGLCRFPPTTETVNLIRLLSAEVATHAPAFSERHIRLALDGINKLSIESPLRSDLLTTFNSLSPGSSQDTASASSSKSNIKNSASSGTKWRTPPTSSIQSQENVNFYTVDISTLSMTQCAQFVYKGVIDTNVRRRVRAASSLLTGMVKDNHSSLSPREVSQLVYGLCTIQPHNHSEDLLRFLVNKIKSSAEKYNVNDIRLALHGATKIGTMHAIKKELLDVLNPIRDTVQVLNTAQEEVERAHSSTGVVGYNNNNQSQNNNNSSSSGGSSSSNSNSNSGNIFSLVDALKVKVNGWNEQSSMADIVSVIPCFEELDCSHREVRQLFKLVTHTLETRVQQPLPLTALCTLLSSIHYKQQLPTEISQFLSFVATQIPLCPETFTVETLSNTLYAMRRLSSEEVCVRHLCLAIAHKANDQPLELTTEEEVRRAFFGFQNLSCKHPEVRLLLSMLTGKMNSSLTLSPFSIESVFTGISSFDSNHAEVKALLRVLIDCINKCAQPLPEETICGILYTLRVKFCKEQVVRELLHVLAGQLRARTSTFSPNPRTVQKLCSAIFGMNSMNSMFPEVCQVVEALVDRFEVINSDETYQLNAHTASSLLFGIRSMNSDHPAVIRLAAAITPMLWSIEGPDFNCHQASMALSSLEHKSSEHDAIRKLVRAVTMQVLKCSEFFNLSQLGFAMAGLSRLSSEDPAVRELLSYLRRHLNNCGPEWITDELSPILSGLTNKSSKYLEVQDFIHALIPFIQDTRGHFDAAQMNTAIGCFNNLNCDHGVVMSLLGALLDKIPLHPLHLNHSQVAGIVSGFSLLNSDFEEVRQLLSAVTPSFRLCTTPLTQTDISALFHFRNLNAAEAEVSDALDVLLDNITTHRVPLTGKAICRVLHGFRNSSSCPTVSNYMRYFTDTLINSPGRLDSEDIAKAMGGLTKMSCDDPSIIDLIGVLSDLSGESVQWSNQRDASNACRTILGCRGFSTDHDAVRRMLTVMTDKLLHLQDVVLTLDAICEGMRGLRGKSLAVREVSALLETLLAYFMASDQALSPKLCGLILCSLTAINDRNYNPEVVDKFVGELLERYARSPFQLDVLNRGQCLEALNRMRGESPKAAELYSLMSRKEKSDYAAKFLDLLM